MQLFYIALLITQIAWGLAFHGGSIMGDAIEEQANSEKGGYKQHLQAKGEGYNPRDVVQYLCNQREPVVNKPRSWNRVEVKNSGRVQNLKTPNFDIQILAEDSSNPEWRKYARFFGPVRNFKNIPSIEIGYSPSAGAGSVDDMLSTFKAKQHIIILYPRYCFNNIPYINRQTPLNNPYRNEFQNHFLPAVAKHLQNNRHSEYSEPNKTEDIDGIIERILATLQRKEIKERNRYKSKSSNSNDVHKHITKFCNHIAGHGKPSPQEQDQMPFGSEVQYRKTKRYIKDSANACKNGYLFMVQSPENSVHDVLLRVLQFVKRS